MIRFSLDLELNTDGSGITEDIIQVGYTAFNALTGEIVETSGDYIKIEKPLYPYIINLTGITQKDIDDNGVSISQSYKNLLNFLNRNSVKFFQMVTWGGGDLDAYKKEVTASGEEWTLGRSECNIKSLYQAYKIANDQNYSGGLKRCMNKCGLGWSVYVENLPSGHKKQRTAHDARCDALNTAIFYNYLTFKLKERKWSL